MVSEVNDPGGMPVPLRLSEGLGIIATLPPVAGFTPKVRYRKDDNFDFPENVDHRKWKVLWVNAASTVFVWRVKQRHSSCAGSCYFNLVGESVTEAHTRTFVVADLG